MAGFAFKSLQTWMVSGTGVSGHLLWDAKRGQEVSDLREQFQREENSQRRRANKTPKTPNYFVHLFYLVRKVENSLIADLKVTGKLH